MSEREQFEVWWYDRANLFAALPHVAAWEAWQAARCTPLAPVPPAAEGDANDALRREWADRIAPLVGPLLDAWEQMANDERPERLQPHIDAINREIEAVDRPKPAPSAARDDTGYETVDEMRAAQAAAVMPLIGPLLDAWEFMPNDERVERLDKPIGAIHRAMLDPPRLPAHPAPSVAARPASEDKGCEECGWPRVAHNGPGDGICPDGIKGPWVAVGRPYSIKPDEHNNECLWWRNPFSDKDEKIATFWWPGHPMEWGVDEWWDKLCATILGALNDEVSP